MSLKPAAAAAAPSFGPAVVTLFGQDVPLLAMMLSLAGLVFARYIAPPPARPLNRGQMVALTALLCVIDAAAVMNLQPGPGMAVAFGTGLGFSGLLAVEFFGRRAMSMIRAVFFGDKSS